MRDLLREPRGFRRFFFWALPGASLRTPAHSFNGMKKPFSILLWLLALLAGALAHATLALAPEATRAHTR